jgi:hypothetical protein
MDNVQNNYHVYDNISSAKNIYTYFGFIWLTIEPGD